MNKILVALVLGALAYAGCKKRENVVSTLVTVSIPVVTVTSPQYISLHIGDPLPTITGVAFDTFYRDSLPVLVDLAGVDNTTPGLYVVKATARNKFGHIGIAQVYIAITEISDTLNLAGWYLRTDIPVVPGRASQVTKVARGMFITDNVGGVDTGVASSGPMVSAVFAVTSPISFTFGNQQVLDNGVWRPLTSNSEQLIMTTTPPPPDTTLVYAIKESSFGTQVRTFKKQ